MQVVALIAQKGGVGKTSIALAVVVEAVDEGRTVVVLDADPQASACKWRDRRQTDAPVVTDVQPSRLPHAVDAARAQGVELVVIDTPPRSESAAAAKVSDLVVIPCRARQILDLETVPAALQQTAGARRRPPDRQRPELRPPSRASGPAGHHRSARAVRGAGLHAHHRSSCRLGRRQRPGPDPVTKYPPRGRAGGELRQVARWLAQVLAQPDILKGASAHASS